MSAPRALLAGDLMLLIVLAAACTTDADGSTGTATTAPAGTPYPTAEATVVGQTPTDEIVSVLEGRIEAWNRRDGKAAAAFYAEDGILEETDNGLVTKGRSRIAARLQDLSDWFGMEAAGAPVQFGRLVVEPVNLILDGQPGLYVLVFDFGPDGRQIYHQWVMPAGPWE